MQSYEHFSSQDFVADDAFIKWVTDPSESSDAFWLQWLRLHPHKRPEVEAAVRIVKELAAQTDVFGAEELQANWDRIRQKTIVRETPVMPLPSGRRWLAVAASVALLVLAGFGFWQYTRPVGFATAFGEIKTITLPDGSEVTLNGNTELSFARGLLARKVSLNGEAYFKVKKEQKLGRAIGFRVEAGRVQVNVLGTVFNVRNRREHVAVVLTEGKVRLETAGAQLDLAPGEQATLDARANQLKKFKTDGEQQTAWLRHELVYNGETLQTVFEQLQDGFGISTRVASPEILKKRFTGSVTTDSIANFYNQLGVIYHLQVQPVQGGYVLK
nr:FecR domain-containing protein [uncultured Dyadobacter sp.]